MKFSLIGQETATELNDFNALDVYQIKGSVHPVYIRKKSMDFMILDEIFGHECYNAEMKDNRHYHNYRRKFGVRIPQNIIDVGAHIGLSSIYYALQYPNAKIIAIEPETDNYQMLLKNTAGYANIIPVNGAISGSQIELFLHAKKLYAQNQYLKSAEYQLTTEMARSSQKIMTCGIHDIMAQYDMDCIDILKIDVEGSEKEIFESNSERWLSKVKILVVEPHDFKIPGCTKAIFKAVSDYDFYYLFDNSDLNCVMMFLIVDEFPT